MTFGYLRPSRTLPITYARHTKQDAHIATMACRGVTKLDSRAAVPTSTSISTSTHWRRANCQWPTDEEGEDNKPTVPQPSGREGPHTRRTTDGWK